MCSDVYRGSLWPFLLLLRLLPRCFSFQPVGNKGERPFANRETAVERWWEKDGGRDSENGRGEGRQSEKRGYHLAYLACAYLKTDVRIPAQAFFCAGPGARTHSQTAVRHPTKLHATKLLSWRWERCFRNILDRRLSLISCMYINVLILATSMPMTFAFYGIFAWGRCIVDPFHVRDFQTCRNSIGL